MRRLTIVVVLCVTLLFSGVTAYAGCLHTDVSAETYICDGDTNLTNTLIFEGATDNAYETSIVITDPTADRTVTIPNATGTVGLLLGTGASVSVPSTLSTNGVDAADSVWGGTNQLIMEGATANGYETILAPTDATADRTITIPNASGTIFLIPGVAEAANGWSISNSTLIIEGTTADDYETSLVFTDPTADRTITIPDASGTFLLIPAVAEGTNGWSIANSTLVLEGATANDYETTLAFTDPTADRTVTVPDATGAIVLSATVPEGTTSWFFSGQDLKYEGTTANDYETIFRGLADASADAILVAPQASGTLVVVGNGSNSWGVTLWGNGADTVDTGDEVCALAGLTCAYAVASSGGVPLANCQTDVGSEGTYLSAFCK